MSTNEQTATTPHATPLIADGVWRLDRARSSVAFHVRHFYGLMTVKGEFADYEGTLDLSAAPAVELTIRAASLNTNQSKRDEHLRSKDFFDVEHHQQVRIEAVTEADHRELGMTWSPLGILRAPSKLIVRGRLVRG